MKIHSKLVSVGEVFDLGALMHFPGGTGHMRAMVMSYEVNDQSGEETVTLEVSVSGIKVFTLIGKQAEENGRISWARS